MSVAPGEMIDFKIDTAAMHYAVDIYRLGYYSGLGARHIDSLAQSSVAPATQPPCLIEDDVGLQDCGNWSISLSWSVPDDATSGVYLAKLSTLSGPLGSSQIVFVVRDDVGHSDLLFQTSDTTWQAYNCNGWRGLYPSCGPPRAYKVSYNRPFTTATDRGGRGTIDWVFNAEYPMLRWLEANGYDVSYFSGIDTDRIGGLIQHHKVFLSVGHDEYWSAGQRANVEAARDAGVHLAFFSGNEVFWKTRWEESIDKTHTPYRTLVCYKETQDNAKTDPLPNVWTGTWRDPRFSPPADGGRPENALTGTAFMSFSSHEPLGVPAEFSSLRFW